MCLMHTSLQAASDICMWQIDHTPWRGMGCIFRGISYLPDLEWDSGWSSTRVDTARDYGNPCAMSEGSLLPRKRSRLVSCFCLEHRVIQSAVVTDRVQEALVRHVAIVETCDAIWSHDALRRPVGVINLILRIEELVGGITPRECLLEGKMSRGVEVQSDTLILGIHYADLFGGLVGGQSVAFIKA